MRGKKGFISDAMADFFAYLLFFVVVLLFFFLFKYESNNITNEVSPEITTTDYSYYLTSMMYLPVEEDVDLDGTPERMQLGEFLSYYYIYPERYKDRVEQIITEYIGARSGTELSWDVIISAPDRDTLRITSNNIVQDLILEPGEVFGDQEMIVPLIANHGVMSVRIKLYTLELVTPGVIL